LSVAPAIPIAAAPLHRCLAAAPGRKNEMRECPMAKYRDRLPQISGEEIFLTDGGIETSLIYLDGRDLPHFAAFDLLKDEDGREALRRYYERYTAIAADNRVGFILESPTWRSNADWGEKLGYGREALAATNRRAIGLMMEVRDSAETGHSPMVISGCIGPRGDGYRPKNRMTAEEAERYHAAQIRTFRETDADMVTAVTMNYAEEAIGIARAAANADMPVAISFTVETDGNLATGQSLKDAITAVDEATDNAPAYYMINCAHPAHFESALDAGESWTRRIRGIRANASTRSHTELDAATELDDGNPAELGEHYAALRSKHRRLNILGGCCGTDHRHIAEICFACMAVA
jgi:S-methylmethionine-dependent homocysteine/selenocysteine methylase